MGVELAVRDNINVVVACLYWPEVDRAYTCSHFDLQVPKGFCVRL